jgi:aryl-alcohol dehydrogenase-like predicted oxidoreductase
MAIGLFEQAKKRCGICVFVFFAQFRFLKNRNMEYRQLGGSGLRVPVLSFGTATFGGEGDFFKAWGSTDVAEATKLVNVCLDAGVNMFDTANVYSRGVSESILGQAIKGLRDKVLISTKATFPMTDAVNDFGSSRFQSCQSMRRKPAAA